MVEQAKEAKAPVERFIDQFARVYMPVVVLIAVVVATAPPQIASEAWSVWTYRARALLLSLVLVRWLFQRPPAVAI